MSFPRSRTRRFDSSCYRTRLSLESLESREVPATLVGLTTVGSLVEFDSSTPGTLIGSPVTVTGLMTGEHLVGVDYRPLNGILYGVSSGAHVYTINTSTGVATLVSPTAFTPALTGTSFAVNFNAVTDQLRVIGNDGQSLVINPSTGTATADTPLFYDPNDPNGTNAGYFGSGSIPSSVSVVGAAYTNDFDSTANTKVSTLYGIDSAQDTLVQIGGPEGTPSADAGQVVVVGQLSNSSFVAVPFGANSSLDIQANTDQAFASNGATIYSVDLTSGTVAALGTVGGGFSLTGLSFAQTAAGIGSVALSTNTATFPTSRNPIAITVTRTGGATGAGTVDYTTADGTAVAGVDYLANSGTLSFADGQTSRTIFLLLPAGTPAVSPAKTFTLTLSNATGGLTLGSTTAATVTIPAVVASTTPPTTTSPPPTTSTALISQIFAAGSSANGQITVYNSNGGAPLYTFTAFNGTYQGEVHVATGDVNGDGYDDLIVAAGAGAASRIQVIDGKTLSATNQTQIASFYAFDLGFVGGVSLATGDINGDGYADVIVGAGPGAGAHVKVFDGRSLGVGQVVELDSFFAYTGFTGGVTVASGNINGDAYQEVITGAGAGGGPHVKVFDGKALSTGAQTEIASFYAFDPSFLRGITVSAGDVNGDGIDDVIVGAQDGADPHVAIFDGKGLRTNTQTELASFDAFASGFAGGVNVSARDLNRDGDADVIVGAGLGGSSHIVEFSGRSLIAGQQTQLGSFFAFDTSFPGGVYVG